MSTIWIDRSGKRFNPFASHTVNGTNYTGNILNYPEAMAHLGIREIEEPAPPADYADHLYYRTSQDDAPYVIYTRKPQEQIEAYLIAQFEAALDNHLDSVARERKYDDRKSAALRSGMIGSPFHAEGLRFGVWMDSCNLFAYQYLEEVKAGTREMPTVEQFIAALPQFSWTE